MVHVRYQISHFLIWSRCGIDVMKKYRVSTTNVPIFTKFVLETKFVPLSSRGHTVFKRSNFQDGGKRGLGATGKASSYRAKPI